MKLAECGAPERIRTTNLLIRSQMLYPVELRAQNGVLPSKNHANTAVSCCIATQKFRSKFRCIISETFVAYEAMKDRRLLFHVHGRKFYLAPPRRPGGPYYIRFEPPSNCGKRIRVVH